jgi:hypothetical protein
MRGKNFPLHSLFNLFIHLFISFIYLPTIEFLFFIFIFISTSDPIFFKKNIPVKQFLLKNVGVKLLSDASIVANLYPLFYKYTT